MKKAILAKKIGMTQIFNEDGTLTPVTVLEAGPCVVTQVKTVENDGYSAVQVGFEDKRESLVNKPQKGVFDKAGIIDLVRCGIRSCRSGIEFLSGNGLKKIEFWYVNSIINKRCDWQIENFRQPFDFRNGR